MPRLATLIAALVLAVPGSALAQDAGDDQYQDPFAEETAQQQGGGGSGGDAQASQDQGGGLSEEPPVGGGDSGSEGSGSAGSGSAGETGTTPTPAPEQAAPEAETAPGQLPNTGSDPRVLVLCGLAFVLIGVGLRLRTIDPHAY